MSHRSSARLVACAALLICVAARAQAQQRPLVTEDPETIGSGLVLVEGGFDQQWRVFYPLSGLTGDLFRVPTLGLSLGLSSIAEIQIDWTPYQRLSVNEREPAPLAAMLDFTGEGTTDIDDIVIGTKVRLVPEGTGHPAFGVRFATKLPNASNESGLGTDSMDFYVSGLVGKTVESVRIVGNVGLGLLGDPIRGDQQNDVLTYGFSLARAVRQGLEVVGEINGRHVAPSRRRSAGRHREQKHCEDRGSVYGVHRPRRRGSALRPDVTRSELRCHGRCDLGFPGLHHPLNRVHGLDVGDFLFEALG